MGISVHGLAKQDHLYKRQLSKVLELKQKTKAPFGAFTLFSFALR